MGGGRLGSDLANVDATRALVSNHRSIQSLDDVADLQTGLGTGTVRWTNAACGVLPGYFPSDTEQWVAANFHVLSFTQVSLQITDRALCVPLKVAS